MRLFKWFYINSKTSALKRQLVQTLWTHIQSVIKIFIYIYIYIYIIHCMCLKLLGIAVDPEFPYISIAYLVWRNIKLIYLLMKTKSKKNIFKKHFASQFQTQEIKQPTLIAYTKYCMWCMFRRGWCRNHRGRDGCEQSSSERRRFIRWDRI